MDTFGHCSANWGDDKTPGLWHNRVKRNSGGCDSVYLGDGPWNQPPARRVEPVIKEQNMNAKHLLITLALLALVACAAPIEAPSDANLTFQAPMAVNAQGEFEVSLAVRNDGVELFPADRTFDGVVRILDAQGNPVAEETVASLRALEAGDTAWPATLRRELAPGAYELTWGAPGHAAIRIPFAIAERDGRLTLSVGGKGEPVGQDVEPDAAAAPLVDKARADLARALGLAVDEIAVVSAEPTMFRDSSLGVPEPGRVYSQVITPGYAITLEVGEMVYVYHAAGSRIVRVPPKETATEEGAALAQQAVADLAGRLGLPVGQIAIKETLPTMFRDSSLGVAEPGQVYLPAVTPGYIIRLEANGQPYTYHASGQRVVLATEKALLPRGGEAEALGKLAIEDLAGRLRVSADKIVVASVTPTEFRDSSLGVPEEGKFYLQVITPGYIIVLQVEGKSYTYHGSGQRIVRAD